MRFKYFNITHHVSLRPQRVLHSTLSARLIRNVKKVAVGDTKFHSAFVTSRLGGLEFDGNATASDTLNTLDSDTTELQDLSGAYCPIPNGFRLISFHVHADSG